MGRNGGGGGGGAGDADEAVIAGAIAGSAEVLVGDAEFAWLCCGGGDGEGDPPDGCGGASEGPTVCVCRCDGAAVETEASK